MTNYLGLNENLTSDEPHTLSSINRRSSWKITFNGSDAVIIMVKLVDFISSSLRKSKCNYNLNTHFKRLHFLHLSIFKNSSLLRLLKKEKIYEKNFKDYCRCLVDFSKCW